jgi:hypothetical protein
VFLEVAKFTDHGKQFNSFENKSMERQKSTQVPGINLPGIKREWREMGIFTPSKGNKDFFSHDRLTGHDEHGRGGQEE